MRKRSCTARCRNAKRPRKTCKCVCGGANHGQGTRSAFGTMVHRVKQAFGGLFEPAKIELTKEKRDALQN